MQIKEFLNNQKDKVNGLFELLGGVFIIFHIIKLLHDKSVAGVFWPSVAFFTLWGYWNCFYYPKLKQRASFWGGVFVAIVNTIWLSLLIYYC